MTNSSHWLDDGALEQAAGDARPSTQYDPDGQGKQAFTVVTSLAVKLSRRRK
jgi:hypothetical protein